MRDIVFYQTWSGRSPAFEFIGRLPRKQRNKVVWVLGIVMQAGVVPAHYLKKLVDTEGLWEVRVEFGGDAFRLLGFFDTPAILVLVSGFAKKTEQTPATEIALAAGRRRDYFERKAET
jgi:phage-related protein